MRRLTYGLAALALLLGACGGDDDDASGTPSPTSEETPSAEETSSTTETTAGEEASAGDVPTCEEQWTEGHVIEEGDLDEGCIDSDGELLFLGSAFEECDDGRVLRWNDRGWWYDGEGVHPFGPDAEENVPPAAELEACGY